MLAGWLEYSGEETYHHFGEISLVERDVVVAFEHGRVEDLGHEHGLVLGVQIEERVVVEKVEQEAAVGITGHVRKAFAGTKYQ